MRKLMQFYMVLAACLVATPAHTQVKAKKNSGGIALKSVPLLNQGGAGPKLIGGREAKTEDWPASFYSSADGARCTATLVGPRALLLAAHCVGDGQDAQIELVGGEKRSGRCTHAPGWKDGAGDDSADYALCLMGQPVSDVVFETVNLNPTRVKLGNELLLTGYGCTQPPSQPGGPPSGGNDGIYRIGEAKVVALPGDAGNEPNTILTRDATTVCPGDSGGGAYVVLTPAVRVLASVNSRVWYEKGESYLSSTSSPDGIAFIRAWISANGDEKICGVNLSGSSCK